MAGVQTCPYCGKPFKRLKSHLPHCKLAGEASSVFDSGETLFLNTKAGNSVTPKFLNNEKKKGQVKSPGTSPSEENKKGKPDLVKSKAKIKASFTEVVDAAGSSVSGNLYALKSDEDMQKQMKWVPEKRHTMEGSKHKVSEEVRADAQPAEKVPSVTKHAKKSPSRQKSNSKTTASTPTLEPRIQNGKWPSEFSSQTVKLPARLKQTKEASAEQRVPGCLDSSVGEPPPAIWGTADGVELVIENHWARVLRNGHNKSSVQNMPSSDVASSPHKTGCRPAESSPEGAKFALAEEQQIMTVTDTVDRERILGTQLARNARSGETRNAVTEIKTHTSDNPFVGNRREMSGVAAGVKSMLGENWYLVKEEAFPQESPVYHTPESNPFPSFTEVFRERDKTPNKYLRYLEKDVALDSETIVTISQHPGMSLNRPSFHTLETVAAPWFSSPDSSTQPGSLGLEWFPELYSNYCSLGLFSRRPSQWDMKLPETQVLILPSKAQQGKRERFKSLLTTRTLPAAP